MYSENFSELSFLNSYDHGGSESYVSSDCVRMNAVWVRKDDGSFFFQDFQLLTPHVLLDDLSKTPVEWIAVGIIGSW